MWLDLSIDQQLSAWLKLFDSWQSWSSSIWEGIFTAGDSATILEVPCSTGITATPLKHCDALLVVFCQHKSWQEVHCNGRVCTPQQQDAHLSAILQENEIHNSVIRHHFFPKYLEIQKNNGKVDKVHPPFHWYMAFPSKNLSSCSSLANRRSFMPILSSQRKWCPESFSYIKKKLLFLREKNVRICKFSYLWPFFFNWSSIFSEEVIVEIQVLFYILLPSCFGQAANFTAESTSKGLKIVHQSFCWLPCAVWCWSVEHTLRNSCLDLIFVTEQQHFSISGQQFFHKKANVFGYRSVLHF